MPTIVGLSSLATDANSNPTTRLSDPSPQWPQKRPRPSPPAGWLRSAMPRLPLRRPSHLQSPSLLCNRPLLSRELAAAQSLLPRLRQSRLQSRRRRLQLLPLQVGGLNCFSYLSIRPSNQPAINFPILSGPSSCGPRQMSISESLKRNVATAAVAASIESPDGSGTDVIKQPVDGQAVSKAAQKGIKVQKPKKVKAGTTYRVRKLLTPLLSVDDFTIVEGGPLVSYSVVRP